MQCAFVFSSSDTLFFERPFFFTLGVYLHQLQAKTFALFSHISALTTDSQLNFGLNFD